MLDLSRCQNLLEFEFGQALEEYIGERLRSFERASPTGLVGTIPGWCAGLAIRPPVEWCQPSFMLVSLGVPTAPEDDSEYPWDDENVLAIQIERDQPLTPESSRRDRALDRQMLEMGWRCCRFTERDIWEDAAGCAHQAFSIFVKRQKTLLDDGFMRHLEWAAKTKAA